jgi:transposase
MVERMTGVSAISANKLAKEIGVRQGTLSKWLRDARRFGFVPQDKPPPKKLSVEDKARIIAHAAKLTGPELTKMLAAEGVALVDLEQWRLALGHEEGSASTSNRQIRKLQRELVRKDKALAEAAALLILKKNLADLLGDEDDDTDDGNEK